MQIALTVKEERFVKAMEAMAGSVGKLSAELNFKLAKSLKEADAVSRQFAQGFGKVGDKMQSFGQNMSMYVTAPLTLMAGAALNAYGEMDSLERSLMTVEGTSENLQRRLGELREAAKLPGLGFQEAIKGDVALRSVGIAAETSLKILKEFGNANATGGGGKEQLSSIITQLSQMSAKGKVLSEDLKPIITAAPTVAKALKEMFGTVDSGDIQKKLESAGKNSQDFIEMLLTTLEKAPRVTGGFKNAIENVKDSLFVFSANMGKALDKAFDFEGIVNAISTALNNVQTWFNSLSPEIQKTIFAAAGLVAVVGPLMVAIGGIIALAGPVIAAIGAISLPMVALGAIVVSVASTVIRNWGQIEAVLKDTGVWTIVAETVKFTVGVIGEAFGLLFDALTGDWSSFGDRLANITKRLWNAQLKIIQLFVNESLNMIQSFWSIFGGTNYITQAIEQVKMKLGTFVSKITADVPAATNYLKKLNEQLSGLGSSGGGDLKGYGKGSIPTGDPLEGYLKKLQERRDILGKLNIKEIFSIGEKEFNQNYGKKSVPTFFQDILDAGERLKKSLPKILSTIDLTVAGLTIEEQIKNNIAKRTELALNDLNEKVGVMLVQLQQQLVSDFASGIGEAIGQAIGGGVLGFEKVFQNILQTIGSFMVSLGTQMLTADRLIKIAKDLFGTEPGTGAIIALIAGGGLLKGLAGSLFSQTPKFAQGGMVTGPMLAVMGDNASGREMALPWEKTGVFAQAIAANMGGGGFGGGEVKFKLMGEDLHGSIEQYKKKKGIR